MHVTRHSILEFRTNADVRQQYTRLNQVIRQHYTRLSLPGRTFGEKCRTNNVFHGLAP